MIFEMKSVASFSSSLTGRRDRRLDMIENLSIVLDIAYRSQENVATKKELSERVLNFAW